MSKTYFYYKEKLDTVKHGKIDNGKRIVINTTYYAVHTIEADEIESIKPSFSTMAIYLKKNPSFPIIVDALHCGKPKMETLDCEDAELTYNPFKKFHEKNVERHIPSDSPAAYSFRSHAQFSLNGEFWKIWDKVKSDHLFRPMTANNLEMIETEVLSECGRKLNKELKGHMMLSPYVSSANIMANYFNAENAEPDTINCTLDDTLFLELAPML